GTQDVGTQDAPDPTLLTLMASLQRRLGLYEAAFETVTRLASVQPSESIRWERFGLANRLERWSDAADILGPLVEEGTFAHLRGTYIRLLGKAGRDDEVARQVDILLANHVEVTPAPPAIDVSLNARSDAFYRGSLAALIPVFWDLRDAGRDEEAGDLLRRILEVAPDFENAERLRIHLYGEAGELQALAAAQGERWSEEEDPQVLFDEGTRRLTAGDAEGAIDLLQRAAPEFPGLEAVWYNLGMAAYRLERWETVASAFGRASELNPQRGDSFFFGGIALAKLGRCTDAVSALESAVSLDPKRTLAHYYLWTCYASLGDGDAAGRHRQLYDASRQ
ncbi:MAG: tetratricopeptide repeat protein, partial [Acidobacteriota bacterium]